MAVSESVQSFLLLMANQVSQKIQDKKSNKLAPIVEKISRSIFTNKN